MAVPEGFSMAAVVVAERGAVGPVGEVNTLFGWEPGCPPCLLDKVDGGVTPEGHGDDEAVATLCWG